MSSQPPPLLSPGLEITRNCTAICDAIHVRCDAIKICIAVGCDVKTIEITHGNYAVVFIFIHSSHLKFSTVFLIAENAFCHRVTIPFHKYSRPRPNPAAEQPAGSAHNLIYGY
jgi:hypothetical protein